MKNGAKTGTNDPLILCGRIVFLALAYCAAAVLSQKYFSPHALVTPIWPPAGIAVAALLVYGERLWPGVLAGAFVASYAHVMHMHDAGLLAIVTAVSATAGAVVTVQLIRHFIEFPNHLDKPRDVFLLFLLGAPVGCLVSTTFRNGVMVALGLLEPSEFITQWMIWGIGDMFGVVIFMPLLLLLLEPGVETGMQRRAMVIMPVLLLFLATSYTYTAYYKSEITEASRRLERTILDSTTILNIRASSYLGMLGAIERMFVASDDVTYDDYKTFVTPFFGPYNSIQALEWAPVATHDQRAEMEARGQRLHGTDYRFRDFTAQGEMVRAEERALYVPVMYTAPLERNIETLGFDLLSDDIRAETLKRAAASGKPAVSRRMGLVQNAFLNREDRAQADGNEENDVDDGDENAKDAEDGTAPGENAYGIMIATPVMFDEAQIDPKDRKPYMERVRGFVIGVFGINDLIAPVLERLDDKEITFEIYDQSAPENQRFIYSTISQSQNPLAPERQAPEGALSWKVHMTMADRQWVFSFRSPVKALSVLTETWESWMILIGGLILNGIAAAFLLSITGRTRFIEQQVTERTRDLAESEQKFRSLTNSIPAMVRMSNAYNEWFYFNEAWHRFTGSETPYRNWTERIHPDDLDEYVRRYTENYVKRHPFEMEYRLKRVDGQFRWFFDKCVPRFDVNGVFLGYIGACVDIQEKKEQEEEVLNMRQALENAIEGVSELDGSCRYTYVNDAYARMLGFQPHEMLGQSWKRNENPAEVDSLDDAYEEMRATGFASLEMQGQRKDGTIFDKRITLIAKYDKDKDLTGHYCFMQDITKRKEAERDLEEAVHSLSRSNTDLERFAYVASHDLQEPLRMVRSFTGLLKKKYSDRLDETGLEYINIASDAARRMQDLISDLLEYSRVGTEAEKLEECDTVMLLLEAVRNLDERINECGAVVNFDALPIVHCNPVRLTRVFQNLIGNSIKYRRQDESPVIDVTAEDAGDKWIFSVKDNGIGIDEEFYKQVFQPFRRLHGPSEYSGSGMGLAITKAIVENLGGELWLTSEVDRGSTFFFTIPKRETILKQEAPAVAEGDR